MGEESAPKGQRLATQRQELGLPPDHVTAMQTLRLEKGCPLYGKDVHERWVGTRARRRGRHSGSEVASNVTVSEGHTVGKLLAVADAESFHAGPGMRLVVAVKGRPRVATATTIPFFDPQDMRLRA